MPNTPVSQKVELQNLAAVLEEAARNLERNPGDVELDFSSMHRIDTLALRALERLALMGEQKTARIVLRGVNVEIYKTLKLAKLTQQFSFVA